MQINQTQLQIVRGSVLDQNADAIVNAANTAMRGGGALDGAVHRAAGPEMMRELERAAPDGAPTAHVVVTRGHDLPQSWVFHVAGPVWKPTRAAQCDEELGAAYRHCLVEADARALESLAFPSLSTGVYAFPLERAAPLALQTVIDYLNQHPDAALRAVTFALFGGAEHHEFRRALEKLDV